MWNAGLTVAETMYFTSLSSTPQKHRLEINSTMGTALPAPQSLQTIKYYTKTEISTTIYIIIIIIIINNAEIRVILS